MSEDSGRVLDLLGDPWQEARDPRGRKRHQRSTQVAETVAVLRAGGFTIEQIAENTGISDKTLKRYYSRELNDGTSLIRGQLLIRQWRRSEKSTAAARYVEEQLTKGGAQAYVERQAAGQRVPRQTPSSPLGKKEAAQLNAQTAGQGTEWEDDLLTPSIN